MNLPKYFLGKILTISLFLQQTLCDGDEKLTDIFTNAANNFGGARSQKFNRTPDVIIDNGYIVETHNFTTAAGYLCTMFRIPCPHNSSCLSTGNHTSGMPVILYHGLFQSSFHWVQNPRETSLAFMLADAGYDVWLPNARGTEYSKSHILLKPTDKKFWDFSLDDIADEEIPPMIDYILAASKHPQLYYMGYSYGNMFGFAALSLHQQYIPKVKMLVALSPMVYVSSTKDPVLTLSHTPAMTMLYELFQTTVGFIHLPDPRLAQYVKRFVSNNCKTKEQLNDPTTVCNSDAFAYDYNQTMPGSNTGVKVEPSPTSSKTIIHISQMVNSKTFCLYNYRRQNTAVYGLLDPPLYKLWKLDVPVALIWGQKDAVNDPSDVSKLTRHIPNIVDNYKVPSEDFTHTDFIRGSDAPELVYKYVINLLNKGPVEQMD